MKAAIWQSVAVRREWELEDLIDCWTISDADKELIANKYGTTKLGFCLLLKFFEIDARFPERASDIPPQAVDFMARQLKMAPADFAPDYFKSEAVKKHRAQIREAFGFRVCTRGDEDKLITWLAEEVCPSELNEDRQREAVLARCRAEKIEPPGRMARIIGSANRIADERFCSLILSRLPAEVARSLWSIISYGSGPDDGAEESGFFTELKADPGKLGLETLRPRSPGSNGSGRSACRRTCSPTSPSGASPAGGRGPRPSTRPR